MTSTRPTLRLALILAVLLLALPWTVSAQTAGAAGDEDETNPSYLLELLLDGESAEGVLNGVVTAQLFGFLGSTGDVVTITMTQEEGSDLDPYIVLLGPLGQVVAKDDDSGEDPLFSAKISDVELPANGSYFIIASSFVGVNGILSDDAEAEDTAFTIAVSGMTTPPDDESQYFSSALTSGELIEGYSTLAEPVYYFTYVAEAGEVADVTVTSEQFDTLLMVFAPGGNRIAVNDDGDGIGTSSSVSGVELEEAGKYLVFATDVAFPNAGDEDAALSYEGGDFEITMTIGSGGSK